MTSIVAAVVLVALLAACGGSDGEETERAAPPPTLTEISTTTVVETETGDDGAAYGVEVRLDDGSVVEVNLDASFQVIGQEADDDGSGEQEGAEED